MTMSLITHQTTYAERALTYIAKSKKDFIPASEIINNLKIPKALTRKILLTLQKEGILSSIKGPKGGFKLAIPADKISFYDLVRIFQGDLEFIDCMTGKMESVDKEGRHLKSELTNIQSYVKNRLSNLKLTRY